MRIFKTFLIFCCVLSVVSCTTENLDSNDDYLLIDITSSTIRSKTIVGDPACSFSNLIAGQNEVSGEVLVDVIDGIATATYNLNPGWEVSETHFSIGDSDDIPTNNSMNPRIGNFEYSATHPNGTVTVTYTLDISGLVGEVYYAAHAVVKKVNDAGGGQRTETAWADGTSFNISGSWATYLSFYPNFCNGGGPVDN